MERAYAEYAAHQAAELLAIDSPTGFTEQAAVWVQNAFQTLGYDARRTVKGGVLIDLGGSTGSYFSWPLKGFPAEPSASTRV